MNAVRGREALTEVPHLFLPVALASWPETRAWHCLSGWGRVSGGSQRAKTAESGHLISKALSLGILGA